MKVTSDDFKFILQTLNRIDNDSEVEFKENIGVMIRKENIKVLIRFL